MKYIILALCVSYTLCNKASIGIVEESTKGKDGSEYESEFISVDLKKPNEDIKFVASVRLHLIGGQVHINGHHLEHNLVHSIHMMVMITDIVNGVKKAPTRKAVELRVMIDESIVNGTKRLLVEEEFTAVGTETVEQIDVQQLIWISNVRISKLSVKLTESKIHWLARAKDHKMFLPDEEKIPSFPNEGHQGDKVRCNNAKNSTMSRYERTKCWAHHLSWRSKILLFSIGFFGLLTAVLCCTLCAQRRKRHLALQISAPIDDTVSVDMENVTAKTTKDETKYDFHFQFDNTVVVDDKKVLIEDDA